MPKAPAPEPLGLSDLMLGSDPALIRAELLHVLAHRIRSHPRSLQAEIGPSEIGAPCLRRIGFRLAVSPSPPSGSEPAPWRPTVGTAVHAWLASTFEAEGMSDRWAAECRVMVGTVAGQEVWGSCDLYDRTTATVIDWKVVGASTLKSARVSGPNPVYRTQVQLYGNGFRNAGLPVERVGIMYLPVAGELADSVWWSEPFSKTAAAEALSRVDGIARALAGAGKRVIIPALPTAEHYCGNCPWFRYTASPTSSEACPGHRAVAAHSEGIAS
jgi:hypothetical protein